MENKRTPGPWTVDGNDIVIANGDGRELLACAYQMDGEPNDAVQLANARLIAAAPELLEALKALPLEAFDKPMGDIDAAEFVDHARDFFQAMQQARAVIAKVEGQ